MRKTETLKIERAGRDNGKVFILTEMSADAGERWANRALLALLNAGVELPDGVSKDTGMAGLAELDIKALIKHLSEDRVLPLLDEMFYKCVRIKHGKGQAQEIQSGDNCQIEEIATFWDLRVALFKLHLAFSPGADTQTTESTPLRVVSQS